MVQNPNSFAMSTGKYRQHYYSFQSPTAPPQTSSRVITPPSTSSILPQSYNNIAGKSFNEHMEVGQHVQAIPASGRTTQFTFTKNYPQDSSAQENAIKSIGEEDYYQKMLRIGGNRSPTENSDSKMRPSISALLERPKLPQRAGTLRSPLSLTEQQM